MHGMLSAGILIGVFALTATAALISAAALYVAVRVHLAGWYQGTSQPMGDAELMEAS